MKLTGASVKTLNRWHQAGLNRLQPGTERVFYNGEDIIKVMQIPDSELPPFKPTRTGGERNLKEPRNEPNSQTIQETAEAGIG